MLGQSPPNYSSTLALFLSPLSIFSSFYYRIELALNVFFFIRAALPTSIHLLHLHHSFALPLFLFAFSLFLPLFLAPPISPTSTMAL